MAYRSARIRICELAAELTDDQLRAPVPATPQWTVHELLAHLVGGAADAATGRLDDVTTERWTARHVRERQNHSVERLLTEWDCLGPAVDATLAHQQMLGPNLAADITCHEGDLREALGRPRVDRQHWQPFLDIMMLFLRGQFRRHSTLVIRDEEGQHWNCGTGEPTTLLRADGYELLRAAYSRRSRRQIAAWSWTPAPVDHVIDRFGFFGPRDDDQPIPSW